MSTWKADGAREPEGALAEQEAELRELYRLMIRVAYAKVRNKSDAHDVVQDAWVKMLTKRETLREESKLKAWAKAITRNVAANVNKYAGRMQLGDVFVCERADRYMPTEAELMLEISELLAALDPTTRTLILYKFYYGFKDQEIAAALNMPVGTVKAKIHRTRERLKHGASAPHVGPPL